MSSNNDSNTEDLSKSSNTDARKRFREALNKKNKASRTGPHGINEKTNNKGSQASGKSQRLFRRKSGSS